MKAHLLGWSLLLASVALASARDEAVRYARNRGVFLPAPQTAQMLSSLSGLEELVRRAQVVGLGEHDHGLTNETAIRKPFFEYLVRRHGFTHLVMESGYLEGDLVDRYVNGDPAVPDYARASKGMTHSMGALKGNRELIEWMRAYNLDPANAGKPRLHFGGMDIPVVGDDLYYVLTALSASVGPELLHWLDLAERSHRLLALCEALVQKASGGKLEHVDPDLLEVINSFGLALLDPEDQESLLFFAETLPERVPGTGRPHRLAVLARQIASDLRLRQAYPAFPHKNSFLDGLAKAGFASAEGLVDELSAPWSGRDRAIERFRGLLKRDVLPAGVPFLEYYKDYFTARLSRERGLAENLILTAGAANKVLLVGADSHLSRGMSEGGYSAGHFIRAILRDRYVTVATAAGSIVDKSGKTLSVASEQPDSLEAVLSEAFGGRIGFLELGDGPDWFRGQTWMRIGPAFYRHWDLPEHYDGVIFFPKDDPDDRIRR